METTPTHSAARSRAQLKVEYRGEKLSLVVGTYRIGALNPWATQSFEDTVTLPAHAGIARFVACADVFDQVTELSEFNNCAPLSAEFEITPAPFGGGRIADVTSRTGVLTRG